MKPLTLILVSLLSGCASVYNWAPDFPASETVKWEVVTQDVLHRNCGIPASEMPALKACALQIRETKVCHIYSVLTEREAMMYVDRDGRPLDLHEKNHCKGYRHNDMRLSATDGVKK